MSEYIGCSLRIGGKITKAQANELLRLIKDEMCDYTGPSTLKEFKEEAKWDGTANYGQCDDVEGFCETNHISYIRQSDAMYEYDGEIRSFINDEVTITKSTQDGNSTVRIDEIKPYCDLLLALLEQGETALPLFLAVKEESFHNFIVAAIKNPKNLHKKLKKKLDLLLPTIPVLPPLEII